MKKIALMMTISLCALTMACSKNDANENIDKPVETKLPQVMSTEPYVETREPQVSNTPQTMEPVQTTVPTTVEPIQTEAPPTTAPDEVPATGDPGENEEPGETVGILDEKDKYEYIVAYETVSRVEALQLDRCKVILANRMELMGITESSVWIENDKIYIGYNNESYKDMIALIAKKGEIQFRYNGDYVLFDNSKIKSITYKKDYKGDEYLIVELFGEYTQEFATFTQEHISGKLVLNCDGEDMMEITIDMAVEGGKFSVYKVPGVNVLDMLSVYIQTGTVYELNPTTI